MCRVDGHRTYHKLRPLHCLLACCACLQVLELEPGSSWAATMVQELQPEVQQRQEKMKEEMIGGSDLLRCRTLSCAGGACVLSADGR